MQTRDFPARGQIFFWFVRPRKKLYSCVVTYYFICFATKQLFLSYPAITFSRSYGREISLSPPLPSPQGVCNNGSRPYTPIWISTRQRKDRLNLLEALIFTEKFLQKLQIEIKITTALKTHNPYSKITLCSSMQKIYCHTYM